MSHVADWIDDHIGYIPIVSEINHLFGDFVDAELEFIMGLFGVEAKDVISTSVSSQRLLGDATIGNLITKVALEEQRDESTGILERLMAYAQVTRNMYNKYYSYGYSTFVDGLPNTNIRAIAVDAVTIKSIIDSVYSIDCTITESKLGTTNKEAFVGFTLQGLYGYRPYLNTLIYNGYTYSVTSIDYNYDTDKYDVAIRSYEDRTTTITTTTVVTVTNINATTDNKNTTVTERTAVVGTVVGVVSDVTVELSNVNVVVPIGSVVNSSNSVISSSTVVDYVWSLVGLVVDAYPATRFYTVKYWYTTAGEWYYWVYQDMSGTYPSLDAANRYITNLEMLPIITVRNAGVNTNVNKNSNRYKQSKQILDYIGLDIDVITDTVGSNADIDQVQDCFIHFGINPQDTSKVISKALYNMFEYMYEDSVLATDGTYLATVTEGAFNAALKWSTQTRTIVVGTIGNLNTVSHSVNGTTLTVRKQVAPEQYVEYVMTNLATATFITRGGLSGVVDTPMGDPKFSIPMSYFFVNKFSMFEQYELFNKTLMLSLYTASVQHLEWYETEEFGSLLKIVGLVLTVVSFGAYAAVYGFVAALTVAAIGTLIMIGATMLLKMIMKSTDSAFIKGLAAVVFVALAVYGSSLGMPLDASELVQIVSMFAVAMSTTATAISMYTEIESDVLRGEASAYSMKMEAAYDAIETSKDSYSSLLSTQEVAGLSGIEPIATYMIGVDAMMYKAIQVQYEYNALYDYDRLVSGYFDNSRKLGVV